MKRKDITTGMEIGVCDNLRPDSTGNRHWSKGTVTAVHKIYDGTYEVLYETVTQKPRGTTLSRVKPWAEAAAENAVAGAAFTENRRRHEEATKARDARCVAFHLVRNARRTTLDTLAQVGVTLRLNHEEHAVLTITDPAQLERILAPLEQHTRLEHQLERAWLEKREMTQRATDAEDLLKHIYVEVDALRIEIQALKEGR